MPPSRIRINKCANHDVPGELSSARDEKDDAMVLGEGLHKDEVMFQM